MNNLVDTRADSLFWHEVDASGVTYQGHNYCLSGPWYDFCYQSWIDSGKKKKFDIEFVDVKVSFMAGQFKPLDNWVVGFAEEKTNTRSTSVFTRLVMLVDV
jgi:hypothetical protein